MITYADRVCENLTTYIQQQAVANADLLGLGAATVQGFIENAEETEVLPNLITSIRALATPVDQTALYNLLYQATIYALEVGVDWPQARTIVLEIWTGSVPTIQTVLDEPNDPPL